MTIVESIHEALSNLDQSAALRDLPDSEFVTGGSITDACRAAGYDESGRVTVNTLNAWAMTVAEFAVMIAPGICDAIRVIEDNGGGLTIQNTETKKVANFVHKSDQAALDSLKAILDGDDMSNWDLSDPRCYITDEEYQAHASSGAYRTWDEEEIREYLEA